MVLNILIGSNALCLIFLLIYNNVAHDKYRNLYNLYYNFPNTKTANKLKICIRKNNRILWITIISAAIQAVLISIKLYIGDQ